MTMLITRTAVVPIWLLTSALIVVFGAPSVIATGLVLLTSGLAAATILLLAETASHRWVASRVPSTIEVTPSPNRPCSWPNSLYRNIGRGANGG